jgi:membrane-bound serine protease (ClpP class)
VQGGARRAAQPVSEKTVSYVRKEFAPPPRARKRPPLLAEAMVDADVEIKGVIEKGKLLTLTTEEALKHKVADFRADTLEDVLAQLGLGGAEVRRASPNWAENLVRFLTHPVVSSLLITVGMLGIIIEMRTPGFGIAGGLGLGSLALFFWGHWLVQLAGWEECCSRRGLVILLAIESSSSRLRRGRRPRHLAILASLVLSLVGPARHGRSCSPRPRASCFAAAACGGEPGAAALPAALPFDDG